MIFVGCIVKEGENQDIDLTYVKEVNALKIAAEYFTRENVKEKEIYENALITTYPYLSSETPENFLTFNPGISFYKCKRTSNDKIKQQCETECLIEEVATQPLEEEAT